MSESSNKPHTTKEAHANDGKTHIKIEYFTGAHRDYKEAVVVTITTGDDVAVLNFSEKTFDEFFDAMMSINSEIDYWND